MTTGDPQDLVSALLGVPGVVGATIEPVPEDPDGPGTLRLQLAAGADEVEVATAVNHLLRGRFGLAVDAERVRVLDGEGSLSLDAPAGTSARRAPGVPPDVGAASRSPRLVIDRVQLVTAELGVTVSVTLRAGERTGLGESEGAATASALHLSVASATVRAVEELVGKQVRLDVEHVEIADTGGEQTALVVIILHTEDATQRLSGASVVRGDLRQAVIRAVLAAVNRRVEPMLADPAG